MKKIVYLLTLSLYLISCSDKDSLNNDSSLCDYVVLFAYLEKADSLCKAERICEAKACLEDALNVHIHIHFPSASQKIKWLLFSSESYANEQESMVYFEYMFSCLAQLDALERLYSLTDEPQEKISVLKRLFDLFPQINDVVEKYTEWKLQTGRRKPWPASFLCKSRCERRYDEYVDKVQPGKKFSALIKDLPKYLYRRKWSNIDKLLIELDKEYGYETTYDYFDAVLAMHGASLEDYTKCLVKAYMGFSGKSKYYYESGMDYQTFKTLVANQDSWYTAWLQHSNSQNEGFIVEYDNQFISNPTLIGKVDIYGHNSHKITMINGTNQTSIELLKDHKYYGISTILINIDKPLLCALLYKNGRADIVPMILKAKQYKMQDTLVREGYEDGNKKIVYYDNKLNEIEWRLYSEQDMPECDSTGTHIYRVFQYNDSTIYCYYGKDSLLRKNGYARLKKEIDTYSYYDWQNTLLMKSSGDTCVYYSSTDSIQVIRAVNYKTYNTIVTTERRNNTGPMLLHKPSKVVAIYNGIYDNVQGVQYGNIMEIHRFCCDGSYYDGSDIWAIEKYDYDAEGRVVRHAFYDNKMNFQGGMKYIYTFYSVEIQYFDKNNILTKTEVTHQ